MGPRRANSESNQVDSESESIGPLTACMSYTSTFLLYISRSATISGWSPHWKEHKQQRQHKHQARVKTLRGNPMHEIRLLCVTSQRHHTESSAARSKDKNKLSRSRTAHKTDRASRSHEGGPHRGTQVESRLASFGLRCRCTYWSAKQEQDQRGCEQATSERPAMTERTDRRAPKRRPQRTRHRRPAKQ